MKKAIKNYLPKKKHTHLIQVHLDKVIYNKILKFIKKENIKYPELIRSLLTRLVDEENI